MKKLIGFLIIIIGVIGGLYVGGWLVFIHPIIEACKAFDAGALTAMTVGITVVKCIFASAIGGFMAWLGVVIGSLLCNS